MQPLHAWSLESADKLSQSRPAGAKILRPNFQRRVVDRLLPIAAALFLMIGTGLWLQDGRRIDAPSGTLRGGEESRWIVQPADGTRLAEPPQSLELVGGFALPETATYLFEIFDDEDVLLWRSTPQPDPRIKLPSEARLLLPHGDYAWRVLFQDGLERRAGPTARFTVQSQE